MTDRLRVRTDGIGFVYPYTKTELITDNDNITLDILLAEINQRINLINQLHAGIKLIVEDGKVYLTDNDGNKINEEGSILNVKDLDGTNDIITEDDILYTTYDINNRDDEPEINDDSEPIILGDLKKKVDELVNMIPRGTIIEDNKIYLVNVNGEKIDAGTEIIINNNGENV